MYNPICSCGHGEHDHAQYRFSCFVRDCACTEFRWAKTEPASKPEEIVPRDELVAMALDSAKARLEEDGCDCGDQNDPPCALCLVNSAIAALDDSDDAYLWERCYACGHRLAFASDGCPQCGIRFKDGDDPPNWPETCECDRCKQARESSI